MDITASRRGKGAMTALSVPRAKNQTRKGAAKVAGRGGGSVRNKGEPGGSDPCKSTRDPCEVVICRYPGWVP